MRKEWSKCYIREGTGNEVKKEGIRETAPRGNRER